MSYKIFISFTSKEQELANKIKVLLNNAFKGKIDFFFSPDDILAGDEWKKRLRYVLKNYDAIMSILTPRFIERPWAYVEWSAFWLRGKTTYILMTEDLQHKSLIDPMKDTQIIKLFNEEDVKKFLRKLAQEAGIEDIPYNCAFDIANQTKLIYDKLNDLEEKKKYSIFKDDITLLPIDDFEKRNIFWYFNDKEKDKQTAKEIFLHISENSVRNNIIVGLYGRGDFSFLEELFPFLETKSIIPTIIKKFISDNNENHHLVYKLIDFLENSNDNLRICAEFLIKQNKINNQLFDSIIDRISSFTTMKKVAMLLIDNNYADSLILEDVIERFYGNNNVELQYVIRYALNSRKYPREKLRKHLIKLAGYNQKEAIKVFPELYHLDKELFDDLSQKIFTLPELLQRIENIRKN
jgi:hypothetical protein